MTAPKPFELASTDRDTGSLGFRNLRTGVDEIAVLRLSNASFSACPQDHSTSFRSSWRSEALFLGHVWNELGQIRHNTQKPLQLFAIIWGDIAF